MEIKRNFYKNIHLKDGLGIEFAACKSELMREGEQASFTVSMSLLSGIVIDVTK